MLLDVRFCNIQLKLTGLHPEFHLVNRQTLTSEVVELLEASKNPASACCWVRGMDASRKPQLAAMGIQCITRITMVQELNHEGP
jgi:hypothetical protein